MSAPGQPGSAFATRKDDRTHLPQQAAGRVDRAQSGARRLRRVRSARGVMEGRQAPPQGGGDRRASQAPQPGAGVLQGLASRGCAPGGLREHGEGLHLHNGVLLGAPEAIVRVRTRAGLAHEAPLPVSYVDRGGQLHMAFDEALGTLLKSLGFEDLGVPGDSIDKQGAPGAGQSGASAFAACGARGQTQALR